MSNTLLSGSRPTADGSRLTAHGLRFAVASVLLMAVTSCRQDMHDAPRYDPLESSTVLAKGASAQPLVEGTVARGELRDDELLYTGKIAGQPADVFPFAITKDDLDRGQQRYNIYCAPCHGRTGDGNGMVVQRGYRQAATYHVDRLRTVPVGYFVDVMTNGFGAMPDYKAQVPIEDRWRIAAYIRALQLARHAQPTDVPADEMQKMQNPAPAPSAPAAGTETKGHGGND